MTVCGGLLALNFHSRRLARTRGRSARGGLHLDGNGNYTLYCIIGSLVRTVKNFHAFSSSIPRAYGPKSRRPLFRPFTGHAKKIINVMPNYKELLVVVVGGVGVQDQGSEARCPI
jgi:hypothetical protein